MRKIRHFFLTTLVLLCSALTSWATYSGTPSETLTQITASNYTNYGFTAENWQAFENYYAIASAEDLYGFAALVNGGRRSANAVLTANIVVNENVLNADGTLNGTPTHSWTPIGTSNNTFEGTFDGNSHTISGLYFENTTNSNYPDGGNYVGLIGRANGATIKNVGVINSYIEGYQNVGGICGGYDTNITNCYNTGTVSGYRYVGGICGYSSGGTQTNCYNTGTVSGSSYYVGGICGLFGTQINCYNTGTVSGSSSVGGICGSDGTQRNCYYLAGCGSKNTLGVSITAEEFASGKITFLLNGSTSEGDLAWYQTLGDGNDAFPVFDNTHAVVYATQPCTSKFSNTDEGAVQPHSTADATGRCTVCGQYIAQGATLVTESNYSSLNLTAAFVDYYAISNSADLYWFADLVNNGETTANAVLTANIVVNVNVLNASGNLNGTPTYSWTPIGTSSKKYAGTFDGNGHTISGLYFNNTTGRDYPDGGGNVGLIGSAYGATLKNVGVIDSYIRGYQCVGGICGYGYNSTTITNCYNTGTVFGTFNVGGICGIRGTQTNCYNTGTISGPYSSSAGGICGSGGTQTNCYYLAGSCSASGGGFFATAEEFASGKITYRLNGSTSEGNLTWYQTLGDGNDAYPVLDNTRSVVYVTQPCPSFSNDANNTHKDHSSMTATGYCTACGEFIAQVPTLITESNYNSLNLTTDFVGYYAISNSPDLYWFADLVNNGETTANAVLTANIVVNANVLNESGELNGTPTYSWTPIGTDSKNYIGTFDGNGHTISGLYFNNTTNSNYPAGGNYVGLIGYADGAKIKNVGVIDSYIRGISYVGGICGYGYNSITNCYNTGRVSGWYEVGGICGQYGTQTNCYNTGMVSGSSSSVGGICGYYGTQTNCYYLAGSCSASGGGVSVTAEEFESGKITYLLNGRTSGNGNAWRQNRGEGGDAYPVLDKNHAVVYVSHPCTSEFSNTEGAVQQHSTADAIGRCTACGQFIAQGTLVDESNRGSLNLTAEYVGYYAISNSGELYWFADLVNNGEPAAKAVLTADIVVNANVLTAEGELNGTPTYSWTPIGTYSKNYKGTFDGNGHTISGLYFNNTTNGNYPAGGNYVGLIGYADGATIKNVGVIDSYLRGAHFVGGICGSGGTQTNCYNTGTISGAFYYVGGICGSGDTQTNCYNTGTVSGSSSSVGGICGVNGTQTNCYYLAGSCSASGGGVSVTAEEFESGKITYLLNGGTSGNNNAWRQNLGVGGDADAYPVLDKTHAVVYVSQPCTSVFSNTEGAVKEHPSVDALGRCTACGQFMVQGTLVTESNRGSLNLAADFVGYYAISNSGELYWFADLVNNGETTANAVLTADIVVNANVLNEDGTLIGTPTYSWTPIGTYSKNYKGTFDGNGHTISGLYFNNTTNDNYPAGGNYVGLIGYANVATIKNVGVIDSYIKGYSSVGGICGCGSGYYTRITNCYNTGTVSGTYNVGGICGLAGSQGNCYNTGTVSGSSSVGGICGHKSDGAQTNCYYLAGSCSASGGGVSATAEEFASGKIGYLLNQNNNNAWYQDLYSDEYPLLDNTHNLVSGYIEENGDTYTVVGNVYLATNYEIAEGKTLSVPAGASLTTTGETVITNNGTLIVNGTVSGNNLAGSGSFLFNDLIGETDFVLNTTSYTYKGLAYTLENGIDFDISHTILGKEFVFSGSYTATYNNNLNVGTATVTLTNNADAENVVSRQFTISAKDVELVWENTTLTYNGSAQKPTATATGMVNGEELTVSVSGEQTNAGTYTATASISDNNYKLPEVVTKEFTIGKATPTYTAPENLSIKCNESLANITLPAGFAFENLNVELTDGENTLTIKFTPENTDNYQVVEGIEVKVVKAAHAVVTDVAVPATCTESGLTEGSHCSVCNEVLVAQEEIPAAGHKADSVAIENIVAATRTAAGSYDSVVYCSVCKVELSRTIVKVPQIVAETIKLASKPNKVEYKQGEALDVKGGKITIGYSDKSTEDYEILTGWVSGFNSEKVGKQTLTVSFEAVSSTLTTTFDVTVSAKDDDNTAIDEDAASKVNIYAYQNVIVVENANAEIYVYDAMGRLVERNIGNDSRTEIRMNNAGVYIVKVGNAAKRVITNN